MSETSPVHGFEFLRESYDPPDSIEFVDWPFSRYPLRKRFHRSPEWRCRGNSLLRRQSSLEGKICYRRALMLTTCRRNARTGPKPPAQGIAKRVHMASVQVVGMTVLLLGLPACQRQLDMAKTYDDRKAETTIRYIGVREGTRQYADYTSIRSDILTDSPKTER